MSIVNNTSNLQTILEQVNSLPVNGEVANINNAIEDAFITRAFTTYVNDRTLSIGSYAFACCSQLSQVSFPNCSTIGMGAFQWCYSLTSISFPKCDSILSNAFEGCTELQSISFPKCRFVFPYAFAQCDLRYVELPSANYIYSSAFSRCWNLVEITLPYSPSAGTCYIDAYAFHRCGKLTFVKLTGSCVWQLSNSNAFSSTPIVGYGSTTNGNQYGSIYVPSSLLTQYQTATNWTYFSSRFVGI